jgi:hypothetical protein
MVDPIVMYLHRRKTSTHALNRTRAVVQEKEKSTYQEHSARLY